MSRWPLLVRQCARPTRAAVVLAFVVSAAGLALSCAGGDDGPPGPVLTSLAEVARLDRRALERGRAVDADAITAYHDASWERLIVEADGHCVAVDATGID